MKWSQQNVVQTIYIHNYNYIIIHTYTLQTHLLEQVSAIDFGHAHDTPLVN